ncbi:MAG TPA: M28 family peptidase [Terriglobales bacterium]|nr:M28 family peptidase [Terriglobales bacterium]
MPLASYVGPLPPLSPEESGLRDHLAEDVRYLSTLGERSTRRAGSLQRTAEYIRDRLQQSGYQAIEQPFSVQGETLNNLEGVVVGSDAAKETIVIGAHYDSAAGTVGANDNATGVAATLELARLLRESKPHRTMRFVFFVNEEPPYFQSENMGSLIYARQLRREGIPVKAMISLETIGFYSDVPHSQKYPSGLAFFYPSRGNFIAFVANPESGALVRRSIRRFRESTNFPSEGAAAPAEWPGVGWSDHWSFWQESYPAFMVTDTAAFRYPYYHTADDTFEKLDFEKAARVADGIRRVILMLANES